MPYVIKWGKSTCFVSFSGDISLLELEAVNHQFTGYERFDSLRFCLWDFSDVSSLIAGENELELFACIHNGASRTNRLLRGAIVATNDRVRRLAAKYLAFSRLIKTDWNVRLFKDYHEAVYWLEI